MIKEEKGCVYFFKHKGLTPIKIGYSSHESPISRFDQFKTYAPYGAEIVGFIKTYNPSNLETELHNKYSSKRLKGEWFDISVLLVKKEIDYHTLKEDKKKESDFQLAWAKSIIIKEPNTKANIKDDLRVFIGTLSDLTSKEKIKIIVKKFPKESITVLSKSIGISRQTFYKHLNNITL